MKKGAKIAIIIVVCVLVIAAIVAGVFIIANREKPAKTAEEFDSIMEEKGYRIINAIAQFSGIDEIKSADIALEDDANYQIEFYEIVDEDTAKQFYESNKKIFEESKGDTSVYTDVSGKNYAKYTLTTDGKYMVISRIDNTVIYISIDSAYKDVVSDILKELGY